MCFILNIVSNYMKILMIKDFIKSLVERNKIVYVFIGFMVFDNWSTIFDFQDTDEYKTKTFKPLINFLKTYKISGISINCQDIYFVSKI